MNSAKTLVGIVLLTVGFPGLRAIELQPSTLKAWDEYIRTADLAMQARLSGRQPFLWVDEAPGRSASVQRGKTLVAPAVGNGITTVPGGLIHHWIGAVFIPRASITSLHAVFRDYDHYKDYYKPVVADSKRLPCTGADERFSMTWAHRVLFVNAAIEAHYQTSDFAVDARRAYNIATTIQVREIEAYGQRDERLLPPGQGSGYIWRMQGIARFEERDGGVYLEIEAIALTRDIPASLRWLVCPVVNHLSINSLTTTLRQTRDAVRSLPVSSSTIAADAGRSRNPRLVEK
jgi:hypothetical protein